MFFKHPSTVVGPDDDVRLPPGSIRTGFPFLADGDVVTCESDGLGRPRQAVRAT